MSSIVFCSIAAADKCVLGAAHNLEEVLTAPWQLWKDLSCSAVQKPLKSACHSTCLGAITCRAWNGSQKRRAFSSTTTARKSSRGNGSATGRHHGSQIRAYGRVLPRHLCNVAVLSSPLWLLPCRGTAFLPTWSKASRQFPVLRCEPLLRQGRPILGPSAGCASGHLRSFATGRASGRHPGLQPHTRL